MAKTLLGIFFDSKKGYKGDNLYDGNNWFAELSNDYSIKDYQSLGGLPYRYRFRITYKGKSQYGMKGDVGAYKNTYPKIGIHKILAERLHFPEQTDYVTLKQC